MIREYAISFFCPAYNDEKNIEETVISAINFLKSVAREYEVIVIDDGSSDATGEVADSLAKNLENVRVIHHLENKGYGAALRTGFKNSKYPIIIYTDGDHQFDITEFSKMLPLLKNYDCVIGFRINRADSALRLFQSKVYNFIINVLFGLKVKDVDCAMKAFHRYVIENVQTNFSSTLFCAELLLKIKLKGFRVAQVGVHHYPRKHGKAAGGSLRVVIRTIIDLIKFYYEYLIFSSPKKGGVA